MNKIFLIFLFLFLPLTGKIILAQQNSYGYLLSRGLMILFRG
jgi:hypothetical protein